MRAAPEQPTSRENLQSFLDANLAAAQSTEEDVLLSEGRIVSERRGEWEPDHQSRPVANASPRTAIFRAREAYREKVRAKAAHDRHADGLEAVGDVSELEPLARSGPATATHGSMVHSTENGFVEPPESALVEPRDEFKQCAATSAPLTTGMTLMVESFVASRALDLDASIDDGGLDAAPDFYSEAWQDGASEVCEPEPPELDGYPTNAPNASAGEEDSDTPAWFRVDLPHVCRACRDFRPGGDGQRGWCANRWAFTQRQMVQDDDVSPCHSTIGDWWVPVDDVWLVAADVSAHGRPTPLLDRHIAPAERRRRGS